MADEEKKDVGAIWEKLSAKNTKYLGITITIDGVKHQFVAFKNHKAKDTHPDYRIFPTDPKYNKKSKPDPEPEATDPLDGYDESDDDALSGVERPF